MNQLQKAQYSKIVKQEAAALGFDDCGIAQATFLEEEAPLLEKWLAQGSHGKMQYMENHFEKRLDPRKLVPGAKSVISLTCNYYPPHQQNKNSPYKISKYAYGRDYHKVIRKKLKTLLQQLQLKIGKVEGRGFVDSAPILDKAWAKHSGTGWMGKHTNILNRSSGSFFFIAELIIDLELEYDAPVKDYCGTCTKCIDACPTDAITPYQLDASKCISYLTIELRDDKLPDAFAGKTDNWIFGCDICQDVCPWNRFSQPHRQPDFGPRDEVLNMKPDDWEQLTEEVFQERFSGMAVKRAGFQGLKRNIHFVKKHDLKS